MRLQRLKPMLHHRVVRVAALLALLSVTALAALWQQTSASSAADFAVPAAPHRSPAAGPSPSASPAAATSAQPAAKSAANRTVAAGLVVTDPASLTVVVNKQRALPTSYVPAGLTVPSIALRYSAGLEQSHLRADAAIALEHMVAAANADGVHLALVSGYRSAAYQTTVYNNSVRAYGVAATDQGIARPGHSEHQTGLAADLGTSSGACDVQACFADTPEGQWLATHAAAYGFIIRYPDGQDAHTGYEYEPWHVRYVGSPTATAITDAGQILEEYLGLPYAPGY
jgi:D-alanyl-D-alanine carboxypeptidase